MESKEYIETTVVTDASSITELIFGTIAAIEALYSRFGLGEFHGRRHIVLECVVNYMRRSLFISVRGIGHVCRRMTPLQRRISKTLPKRVWVHTTLGGKDSSTFLFNFVKTTAERMMFLSTSVTKRSTFWTKASSFEKSLLNT